MLALSGCGTSGPQPIGVTLAPSSKSIDQSQTVAISASVAHDTKNGGVQWTVSGGGTLSGATTTSATYNTPASVTTAFTATVTGTSVTDPTKSATSQIKVNPSPVIGTTSPAAGTAGTAYSATLSVSGGTSPFTWSVTSGTLPAGLSLNASTGAITGTPTGASSSSVTFQVVDAAGMSATQALTIAVSAPPALTITTKTLPAGVMGTAYNQTLQATGGVPSYTWSVPAGTLPAGLSLSSGGVISGTPTGTFTGATTFTVTLTDSQTPTKASTTANLSISVSAPLLKITTTSPLPGASIGTAYSQTLQASGGAGSYTWSLSGNPSWLSINSTTGALSGTPNGTFVGLVSFTASVTDSETPTQQASATNFSITISVAPLSVTTTSASLAQGIAGSVYAGATLQATGGIPSYSWQVTTGSLPAGLTLNGATGAISGTPTTAGTTPFTVTVTDSETPTAKTATANLSIVVGPAVSVVTTTLPAGVVGTAYAGGTLQATGGTGPYSWSVTTGTLPSGLTLSNGAITGTPTGRFVGTTSFTVTVTDGETPAKTATANLSIAISATTLNVVTSPAPPIGVINSAYSTTLQATGGVSPYTLWTVVSGNLPTGLSLDQSGNITGTPTATGTFTFTVSVTDSEIPTPQSAQASLSISINATAPLGITQNPLPAGILNTAYSSTVQATGGVTPYTWAISVGTLPAGLSLNTSTGAITGTPTTSGTSNFTVKVTDSTKPTGLTATAAMSITINAPLAITTTTLPGGTVGSPYNGAVNATGGVGPYTWKLVSGSLPNPLSFNFGTGNSLSITGTPSTAGTSTFTVSITDSEPTPVTVNSGTLSITISALPPLTITTTSLPAGSSGVAYSATVNASGGMQPYNWSITSGSLPAGLSPNNVNNSLSISGTPTATGTFPLTIQVTDSETPQGIVSANFNLTITAQACTQQSLLHGTYAVMVNGWSSSTTAASIVGSMVADGSGNISSATLDVSDQAKGNGTATFTGTYCVGANNLTSINLVNSDGKGGTATFEAALDASDGNGHIITYDNSGQLTAGLLRKQDTTAFLTSKISGNYAFGLVGADPDSSRFGMAGQFNSNGNKTLNGEVDGNSSSTGSGSGPVNTTMTATDFTVVSSTTGRGTVSITFTGEATINFVFYVVSSSEMLMIAEDTSENPPMILAGQVLQQSSSLTDQSLNGVSVIETQSLSNGGTSPSAAVGLLTTNGTGTFSVTFDQNKGGTMNTQTISGGSYSVDSVHGRVTLAASGQTDLPVLYLVGKNQAFLVGTNGGVDFGLITPQTGSSFTKASLSGNYYGGSQQPVNANGNTEADYVNADGKGNIAGTSNNDSGGGPSSQPIVAAYCMASSGTTCASSSNGRVILTCTAGSGGCTIGAPEVILYIISPTQAVVLPYGDSNPKLIDFHQ
jgi:hypothetical protein